MQNIIFTLVLITAGVTLSINVSGQTFSEWWQQKKTRIKRLKEQVAALGTLREAVEAGYSLAEKGVDSVEAAEKEEFLVNKQFIERLRIVKPSFKDDAEVILVGSLFGSVVEEAQQDLRQLVQLTRDGALEMEDGPRYEAIRAVEARIRRTYEKGRARLLLSVLLINRNKQSAADDGFLKTILP